MIPHGPRPVLGGQVTTPEGQQQIPFGNDSKKNKDKSNSDDGRCFRSGCIPPMTQSARHGWGTRSLVIGEGFWNFHEERCVGIEQ
jgi:hypothetical protein